MKVRRKFYRALMQGEHGRYVTANYYELGGDAELQEKARWLGFTSDFIEAECDIDPDDFSEGRDTVVHF